MTPPGKDVTRVMEEPPPFLRTWRRVYTGVVLYLLLLITAFYIFTKVFNA